ncbi:THO complex subunit 4d [Phtheirospermum japonicum]|uniref:THO complex subunit 4d n=1 Tax=Phtheirospermum japonicum TaxID=374723 RepID=A0A830B9J0_9LAMI|nr:THO complex subunit 4d [Phtheirospermum japonicum]
MASLDMSLEDMIKNRRNNDKRSRGHGRLRRGRGLSGELDSRLLHGTNLGDSIRRTKNLPWQSGLFEDGLKAAGLSGLEAGSKLYISNLDVGVSNEDIRELFLEIGELIRYAIHFDKNGRPSGSAEVVFARRIDAFQAFKRYNNVQLDGRPMKIEIIGSNAETPISTRVNVGGAANGRKRTVVMASVPGQSRGGFAAFNRGSVQRGRGGSSNGREGRGSINGRGGDGRLRGGGRGRGRGRGGARWVKNTVEKSADDLDKELETYHAEAMQS